MFYHQSHQNSITSEMTVWIWCSISVPSSKPSELYQQWNGTANAMFHQCSIMKLSELLTAVKWHFQFDVPSVFQYEAIRTLNSSEMTLPIWCSIMKPSEVLTAVKWHFQFNVPSVFYHETIRTLNSSEMALPIQYNLIYVILIVLLAWEIIIAWYL